MKDEEYVCGWNALAQVGSYTWAIYLWWTVGPGYISFHPTFDTHVTTQGVDTWAFTGVSTIKTTIHISG